MGHAPDAVLAQFAPSNGPPPSFVAIIATVMIVAVPATLTCIL